MRQGLKSHSFHTVIGFIHNIPIIRIPYKKGGMRLSPIEGVEKDPMAHINPHFNLSTPFQQVGAAPCHQGYHAPCRAETSAGHVAIVQPCQPKHSQTVGNHRAIYLGPAHFFIYTPKFTDWLENHHIFFIGDTSTQMVGFSASHC